MSLSLLPMIFAVISAVLEPWEVAFICTRYYQHLVPTDVMTSGLFVSGIKIGGQTTWIFWDLFSCTGCTERSTVCRCHAVAPGRLEGGMCSLRGCRRAHGRTRRPAACQGGVGVNDARRGCRTLGPVGGMGLQREHLSMVVVVTD